VLGSSWHARTSLQLQVKLVDSFAGGDDTT
jgi:hypothetical protein